MVPISMGRRLSHCSRSPSLRRRYAGHPKHGCISRLAAGLSCVCFIPRCTGRFGADSPGAMGTERADFCGHFLSAGLASWARSSSSMASACKRVLAMSSGLKPRRSSPTSATSAMLSCPKGKGPTTAAAPSTIARSRSHVADRRTGASRSPASLRELTFRHSSFGLSTKSGCCTLAPPKSQFFKALAKCR
jgi:hypothetical protein